MLISLQYQRLLFGCEKLNLKVPGVDKKINMYIIRNCTHYKTGGMYFFLTIIKFNHLAHDTIYYTINSKDHYYFGPHIRKIC